MEKHTVTVEIETQDPAGDWHYPLVAITVDYEPEQAGSYEPGGPDAPEGAHVEFLSASLPWPYEGPTPVEFLKLQNWDIDALAADYAAKHSDSIIDQIKGN